jgi:hypothetical protein
MRKPLTADNLYICIIQNAASKMNNFSGDQVNDYVEGAVSTTARIILDTLRIQGMIEGFTVTWAKTNGFVTHLIIQIQKDISSQYTVYRYSREQFSKEIMEVAEVMMT